MGACYLYGQTGGGGEKIKAVSGTTAPETAGENALWVQTDTPVTDYVFSPVQPESAAEGTVWFHTIGEGVNFILDKKQKLRVNIKYAFQYVDGAWVRVSVSLWTDGGWGEIVSKQLYLYHKGDQCEDLTGGWKVTAWQYSGAGEIGIAPSVTYKENSVYLVEKRGSQVAAGTFEPNNRIDLTGIKTIRFHFLSISTTSTQYTMLNVGVFNRTASTFSAISSSYVSLSAENIYADVDVSSLSGEHYVGIWMRANNTLTAEIDEIRLVREGENL